MKNTVNPKGERRDVQIKDQGNLPPDKGTIQSYSDVDRYLSNNSNRMGYTTAGNSDGGSDTDYWKNLSESSWIASFNLSMSGYFAPLKAKITRGTPENNAAYTFDKDTLKLTVNEEAMRKCLVLWTHMNIARTEVLLALRNVEGFEFIAYLSSLDNAASRARDKVLYRIIEKERPEYTEAFLKYQSFIKSKEFNGSSIIADNDYYGKSFSGLINLASSETFFVTEVYEIYENFFSYMKNKKVVSFFYDCLQL